MTQIDDETIGHRLGALVLALVDLIAELDGVEREDVLERLFTAWWTSRISE